MSDSDEDSRSYDDAVYNELVNDILGEADENRRKEEHHNQQKNAEAMQALLMTIANKLT